MLKIGLTGNIGSGKTTIAKFFNILNIPVYNADTASKKLLNSSDLKTKIVSSFGEKIIKNNVIDKKTLAAIVFTDNKKLQLLNSIVHPFVISDFSDWCKSHSHYKYIIIEAAILFESGYNTITDKIICVTCPDEIRINRIINRDNLSREDIINRMNNQLKEDEKIRRSDFIIVNDDKHLIIPQILEIHNTINSF